MIKIIHVIEKLSLGGGPRAVLASAKYSSQIDNRIHHEIISLLPPKPEALLLAQQFNITVHHITSMEQILSILEGADIVQVDWWNSPSMTDFLNTKLPNMRLLIWFHVAGDKPPQVITAEMLDICDVGLATSLYTDKLPLFRNYANRNSRNKLVDMIFAGTDFERLQDLHLSHHSGFNVGYIGTLDFVKLHQDFIAMSSSIDVPNVRFIICGKGVDNRILDTLRQQAEDLRKAEIFEFRGYVDNIASAIEIFDVYGYPLCENTYASSELNLQEIMFAGIPPIVFPYGGIKYLVTHQETGLVVNSASEYKLAIEYLYLNPKTRKNIGENAREYARKNFGARNWSNRFNLIYYQTMKMLKRKRKRLYEESVYKTAKDRSNSVNGMVYPQFFGVTVTHAARLTGRA